MTNYIVILILVMILVYNCAFSRNGRVVGNQYGAGSGTIWLDGVQCNGSETHITDCQHRGWGNVRCGNGDVVYISCFSGIFRYHVLLYVKSDSILLPLVSYPSARCAYNTLFTAD